jgi:hypothetical protein
MVGCSANEDLDLPKEFFDRSEKQPSKICQLIFSIDEIRFDRMAHNASAEIAVNIDRPRALGGR